jgi:hypothetical protein
MFKVFSINRLHILCILNLFKKYKKKKKRRRRRGATLVNVHERSFTIINGISNIHSQAHRLFVVFKPILYCVVIQFLF